MPHLEFVVVEGVPFQKVYFQSFFFALRLLLSDYSLLLC